MAQPSTDRLENIDLDLKFADEFKLIQFYIQSNVSPASVSVFNEMIPGDTPPTPELLQQAVYQTMRNESIISALVLMVNQAEEAAALNQEIA